MISNKTPFSVVSNEDGNADEADDGDEEDDVTAEAAVEEDEATARRQKYSR